MRKLFTLLLATMMMTTSLAGCGAKTDSSGTNTTTTKNEATSTTPTPEVAAPDDPTALKADVTWWAFPTFSTTYAAGEYEQQMVAAFNEKYPNVNVKVEMIDFTSGPEKIIAAIQGGTAPDILFDAPGRIVDYGKNGKLANLNDMFTDDFKKDVNNEKILASCSDGSNYWMYPLSSAPFVMAIDQAVLEKEGLMDLVPTTGDRTWTTEEFTKLNEELAARGYKNGIIFCSGQGGDQGTRAFVSNLYSSSITNNDLTAYTINDANGVKALQYCMDQVNAGNLVNGSAYNGGEAIEQFVSGNVTTTLLWAPVNAANNKETTDASGVKPLSLPLPSDDGKPSLEFLVNGFCVFDNGDADKIAASKEFIKFICDDKEWGPRNVVASKGFPVRGSFGDLYPGDADMAFYASMANYYGTYYNTIDGFATMRPSWFSNIQAALAGDKTAQQAMDDYVNESNAAIAANKK
ncbi:MAG: ABC transporter substrate-binding protein [Cellulosilyticaceae bacterium]